MLQKAEIMLTQLSLDELRIIIFYSSYLFGSPEGILLTAVFSSPLGFCRLLLRLPDGCLCKLDFLAGADRVGEADRARCL